MGRCRGPGCAFLAAAPTAPFAITSLVMAAAIWATPLSWRDGDAATRAHRFNRRILIWVVASAIAPLPTAERWAGIYLRCKHDAAFFAPA